MAVRIVYIPSRSRPVFTGWFRTSAGGRFLEMIRDRSERKVWDYLLARLPPGDKCVTTGKDPNAESNCV
jgi:hypothetical protein